MVMLRDFTIDDAESLRQSHYRNMSVEAVRKLICEWNKREYEGKYFEMFAVIGDNKIVGELSLYEHSESIVSIGLEIFSQFQGQGYGKQALMSALQICGSKRYKIVCYTFN